jgi:5-bromo-4-chloroindolyl phosphate hydrolysis protein
MNYPTLLREDAGWFHFRKGLSSKEYRKKQELGEEEAKTVKNGLVKAKQKAKPDHELYRTIKADPRPSKK